MAFAILFVGGATIFLGLALDKYLTEKKRVDAIAQASGFNDQEEMAAAKMKGFDRAGPYRAETKRVSEEAQAERAKIAASEAKAKAVEDAKKQAREARFREGVVYALALKKGMKNPDSFKLETAVRMPDGVFCFEYRATNSFNAIVPGRAFVGAGKAGTSDDGATFGPLWNRYCGKSGEDFDTIVYGMKNGYF
jgi:hypothetical protein